MSGELAPLGEPVPAEGASADLLLELTHGLRRELLGRGEFLPPDWVEEAANDLRRGRLRGWVLLPRGGSAGVAFFSPRPGRSYGHVHVTSGAGALEASRRLLLALVQGRDRLDARLDVGLTGLSAAEEDELRSSADPSLGESPLLRFVLEVGVEVAPDLPPLPEGLEHRPVRDADSDTLAQLDWIAFQGTADETLVADTPEEDARVLGEIRSGLLGRFLDEASTLLVDAQGRVVGFLLTAEQTPRRAVFLDLVVAPDRRKAGLGRYLLAWGRRALTALGYSTVRLWVSETNFDARRLYDRAGFVPAGRALVYRILPTTPLPRGPQPHRPR